MLRLAASRRFQTWAARMPVFAGQARREGEAMMGLISGFVQSQCLFALIELDVLTRLSHGPQSAEDLSDARMPAERMELLLRGAVALGLVRMAGDRYALTVRGAASLAVPGLSEMVRHHKVLYADLADPVAVFRGDGPTALARFWPYVFGADGAVDPGVTQTYSDLMADSQALVAEDTLRMVDFADAGMIMDVGGGTGAFLTALGRAVDGPRLHLFDLPAVVPGAESRFRAADLTARVTITPGSFRDDALPQGADTVTLVRVLYDHADATVRALLAAVLDALPPGGRIVVSEPMTGGDAPTIAGDIYFATYCMAMGTGRARSSNEISALLTDAGFEGIEVPRAPRPFVTSAVVARKPG
ncbi:MAG: methyltransferase [Pseudomonadota bacterium]